MTKSISRKKPNHFVDVHEMVEIGTGTKPAVAIGQTYFVVQTRLQEIQICINNKTPLAFIILCGSILEGILLGGATKNPAKFNVDHHTAEISFQVLKAAIASLSGEII